MTEQEAEFKEEFKQHIREEIARCENDPSQKGYVDFCKNQLANFDNIFADFLEERKNKLKVYIVQGEEI